MKDILRYLYQTYISHSESRGAAIDFSDKQNRLNEIEASLKGKLSDGLWLEVMALTEALRKLSDAEIEMAFADGFVLGARVIIAVFAEGGESP